MKSSEPHLLLWHFDSGLLYSAFVSLLFLYFLFCGVSNSMPVAPPAPASLWMLFMSLFLEQGGDHNIPLGLLQEEGWSLWVCWKSVCSMPAGSVCGNQKPKELQEGEEEAWGHAEHFGVLLRVVVNVCTHSLFSSVWMICYFWSLFLTGAEVQGIVSGSWTRGQGPGISQATELMPTIAPWEWAQKENQIQFLLSGDIRI